MGFHENRRAGARAAVQKGPDGRLRRGRIRYGNEETVAANALTEREAEALIRKDVELALLGTSTVRRDFAADVLQMQPSRIADTNLDCSLEVERIERDFRLMRAIVDETGHRRARLARIRERASQEPDEARVKCGRTSPASRWRQSRRAP
jgi:hypothetical protein